MKFNRGKVYAYADIKKENMVKSRGHDFLKGIQKKGLISTFSKEFKRS